MKTFLRIIGVLIAVLILSTGFLWVLFEQILPAIAEEPLFAGDSDSHELTMTASDELLLDATLNYYWQGDETDYATGTWAKVGMRATVK